MSPLSYASSESRQFIVVVLPEPLGPRSPKTSPFFISRSKWSRAISSLYLFTRLSIFTTVSAIRKTSLSLYYHYTILSAKKLVSKVTSSCDKCHIIKKQSGWRPTLLCSYLSCAVNIIMPFSALHDILLLCDLTIACAIESPMP
jgi:hypothetical protein